MDGFHSSLDFCYKAFNSYDFGTEGYDLLFPLIQNKIPLKRDAAGPQWYSDTSGLGWELYIV